MLGHYGSIWFTPPATQSAQLAAKFAQAVTPPANYVPPVPPNPYPVTTPESHTWLYIGLALGAIVLVGGVVMLAEEH
jgi:hypothetical protein